VRNGLGGGFNFNLSEFSRQMEERGWQHSWLLGWYYPNIAKDSFEETCCQGGMP